MEECCEVYLMCCGEYVNLVNCIMYVKRIISTVLTTVLLVCRTREDLNVQGSPRDEQWAAEEVFHLRQETDDICPVQATRRGSIHEVYVVATC